MGHAEVCGGMCPHPGGQPEAGQVAAGGAWQLASHHVAHPALLRHGCSPLPSQVNDPYTVLIREKKLPLSLLEDPEKKHAGAGVLAGVPVELLSMLRLLGCFTVADCRCLTAAGCSCESDSDRKAAVDLPIDKPASPSALLDAPQARRCVPTWCRRSPSPAPLAGRPPASGPSWGQTATQSCCSRWAGGGGWQGNQRRQLGCCAAQVPRRAALTGPKAGPILPTARLPPTHPSPAPPLPATHLPPGGRGAGGARREGRKGGGP